MTEFRTLRRNCYAFQSGHLFIASDDGSYAPQYRTVCGLLGTPKKPTSVSTSATDIIGWIAAGPPSSGNWATPAVRLG